MKRRMLILLLLALACHSESGRQPQAHPTVDRTGLDSLVGRTYGGTVILKGTSGESGGWLLDPEVYGIAQMDYLGAPIVLLDTLVGQASDGQALWVVLDAMHVPARTASLVIKGGCQIGGTDDLGVLALVKQEQVEIYTDIRAAWRANLRSRRFEPVAPETVTCVNEGFGG